MSVPKASDSIWASFLEGSRFFMKEGREGLWIIALEPLLELKLASGSSAPHRSRDLADVQDLIRQLDLPLETGDRLDPSVREAFRELWKSTRSEETP